MIIEIGKATVREDKYPVSGVQIFIENEIATGKEDRADLLIKFQSEGARLAETLRECLPQGTLDALLIQLLRFRQNNLTVAYEREIGENDSNGRVETKGVKNG